MSLSRRRNTLTGSSAFRKVMLHAALFLLFWLLLMFVIIPMDGRGRASPESYALVEGERAYAAIVRERRPGLVAALRGLNMVNAEYVQGQTGDRRFVHVGNVKLYFSLQGDFRGLEIFYE